MTASFLSFGFDYTITMSQNKRKVFTIEEKSHIIWRLENGESNSEIVKECGVSHSTVGINDLEE